VPEGGVAEAVETVGRHLVGSTHAQGSLRVAGATARHIRMGDEHRWGT
jgi:hypothetical protein